MTAASDGTLVAHLAWAPSHERLQLNLADKTFVNNRSPIVGKLPVTAGLKPHHGRRRRPVGLRRIEPAF